MNKIYLIGNLTRDPEKLETQSGITYCRIGIAVNRVSGDKRDTDFYTATAWRGAAETICKYAQKGNKMAIMGDIALRNYETDEGVKKQSIEIAVTDFEFLTPKEKDEDKPKQESKPKPRLEPYDGMEDDSPF